MDKTDKLLKQMKGKIAETNAEVIEIPDVSAKIPNLRCDTFQMATGAVAGRYLTCTAAGVGSWAAVAAGDVSATAVLTDHAIVRGDGGVKGVQTSALTIDDTGTLAMGTNKITMTRVNVGDATNTGTRSVAVGVNGTSTGAQDTCVAIGSSAVASSNASGIAIGDACTVRGIGGIAIGSNADSGGSSTKHYAIAIGSPADALEANGIAIGTSVASTTAQSTAIGYNFTNSTANSVAFGVNAELARLGTALTVFNDVGANVDFVVEGDTDANLINLDAGLDSVGIGTAAADTKLEVATGSAWGKQAVTIDQDDEDQAFIDFQGTSAADAAKNISTLTVAVLAGYFKIEINGTAQWVQYYNAPTA